jgi:hypothetical protein
MEIEYHYKYGYLEVIVDGTIVGEITRAPNAKYSVECVVPNNKWTWPNLEDLEDAKSFVAAHIDDFDSVDDDDDE